MNDNGKLDILYTSNSLTAKSGYGQQTALFLPRIKQAGYGITLAANYGVQGAPFQTTEGIVVLPAVIDSACNDILLGHYQYSRSDLVLSLYDPHAYNADVMRQFPWCAWSPIDSAPMLPANKNVLQAARWIWAISRHGEQQIRDAGFTNVTYVPHGIDTKTFAPGDRAAARQRLGTSLGADLTDKFIVMVNSANKGSPSRKGFYEIYQSIKTLCDQHADVVLYMHAEALGAFAGENLASIAQLVGLDPSKVFYAPQYQLVCGMLGNDYMADAYNAADVFLSASHGEGFGIPIIEAQSSGTPVVVAHNSAQIELCLTGLTSECVTYMPVTGATWGRPKVESVVANLEIAYRDWRNNDTIRQQAREKALIYDADTVFETYMKPALEQIQHELYKPAEPQRVLRKRRALLPGNGKVQEADLAHVY